MKNKKGSFLKIEPGSKMPVVFYGAAAVVLSCLFTMVTIASSGFSFNIGSSLSDGDLNNDGIVNAADAFQIINAGKNNPLKGAQKRAADLNDDGKADKNDALLILQYSSKTSTELGIPAKGNTTIESAAAAAKRNAERKENEAKKAQAEAEYQSQSADSQAANETAYNSDEPQPIVTMNPEKFVKAGKSASAAFANSDSDIYTTAKIANKWQSGGKYYYQIDVVRKNNSTGYMSDSSLNVKLSGGANIEKSWGCSASGSDGTLKVTTQGNSYIPNGGSIKCGFVVSSASQIQIDSVS